MTIDQLSQKTILVTLMHDDLVQYALDFASDSDTMQRGLMRLMHRVGEACGLDHSGRSYLIEALPAGESCLLIITVRSQRSRRCWRIKRVHTQECYIFADIDAFLDGCRDATASGNLYTYRGGCWLLPDYPYSPALRRRLAEYADLRELTVIEAARIRELGTPIIRQNVRRPARPRTAR